MVQNSKNSKAQISRASLQRLYIAMRHLFIRGSYKPLGVSGEAMIKALLELNPEIYGSIADPERVELKGLLYVCQRLPIGIEKSRFVKLITREGLENSGFEPIIPSKRRRNCFKIDEEQMFIEMTRGRSDIYDVLTHLTFLYIESEKIRRNGFDSKNKPKRSWKILKSIVKNIEKDEEFKSEQVITYLSEILGRTYEETKKYVIEFDNTKKINSLYEIAFWLGQRSVEDVGLKNNRVVSFSSSLREKIGHHVYGELWSNNIKKFLYDNNWHKRPIHIISSNMHSVMNTLYSNTALGKKYTQSRIEDIAMELSQEKKQALNRKVSTFAAKNGLHLVEDSSGTNISVQIIDCQKINFSGISNDLNLNIKKEVETDQILLVMDYAFGEQAYEVMDELLKPYEVDDHKNFFNVQSINIMGKAGILSGIKGDIMIPNAHVFEGSADNYPVQNEFSKEEFENNGVEVFEGTMITVLGTSLQNRDILSYFKNSSWQAVGLEMEGAHYQKAIQSASKIRKSVKEDLKVRYAYYASDNPLESGSTLASGSLGIDGVKPTYLITKRILEHIFS